MSAVSCSAETKTKTGADEPEQGQIAQLLSSSAALALIPIIVRLAGFAFVILVARGYGERDLGVYRFSLALVWYFLEFARFGLGPLLVRDMAARPVDADSIWRTGLLVRSGAVGLGWVALAVISIVLQYDIVTCRMIALFALAMLFVLAGETNNQAFIATGKASWNLLTEAIGSISFLALGLFALYLNSGIVGLAAAKLLSAAFQAGIGWLVISRHLFPIRLSMSSRMVRAMLTQCWPFALLAVTAYLISEGDVFIIRQMSGFEMVGLYVAAQTLIGVGKSGLAGLGLAVSPLLAEGFVQGNLDRMYNLSRVSLRLAAWTSGASIAALTALAGPLISVMLGDSFGEAASALQIVVWVLPSYAICNILGFGILATGGERTMVKINSVVALTNIGLNVLLIPINPLIGASSAAVLSYLLCLTLYIREAHNRRVCPPDLGRLHLRPALSAAGMFLALQTGIYVVGGDASLPATFALLSGGAILYVCLLWILGDLDKETLDSLRTATMRRH